MKSVGTTVYHVIPNDFNDVLILRVKQLAVKLLQIVIVCHSIICLVR